MAVQAENEQKNILNSDQVLANKFLSDYSIKAEENDDEDEAIEISLGNETDRGSGAQSSSSNDELDEEDDEDKCKPIKCSAVHTLERDMPTFDYSNLIKEVRAKFLASAEASPGMYSEEDIEKCRLDDWHISRFLLRQKMDVEAASTMLMKAMRFRHESLSNSIRSQDFPAEFYQIGGLFAYEPDRKGNQMLYIRVKNHRKVPEIKSVLEAFLYYNIQELDKAANGRGISIVFDCSGGGLANADMDLLLCLANSLINFFPKGLSYLLVHSMPWILKPFWHIAKLWVPEQYRQLIKFSNEQTVYEYIDKENLPDFMGGTCKREHCSPPENCTTLEEAIKLWGIEPSVVKSIIMRFAEYLPPETIERANKLGTNEQLTAQDQDANEKNEDAKE